MATPYSQIYSRFLAKISDYSFVSLTQEELEANLETFLNSAIVQFRRCKKSLYLRDNVAKTFDEDLTDEEQEILSKFMVVEYLTPKLVTADLLQQTLSSRDFKLYSQANHIKEIRDLRNEMKNEVIKMMTEYTYFNFNMDDML